MTYFSYPCISRSNKHSDSRNTSVVNVGGLTSVAVSLLLKNVR